MLENPMLLPLKLWSPLDGLSISRSGLSNLARQLPRIYILSYNLNYSLLFDEICIDLNWIQAWELWRDGQSLELMDSTIGYPYSTPSLVRYINIGLLCVQESSADRPTMPDVISMISNEYAPLPAPKQPAFTAGRNMMHKKPTINSAETCSINSVTVSVMEARWVLPFRLLANCASYHVNPL